MYNRKRRKIYKKFWQLLKKGQTNWECFYTNPCNRIPRLLPSNLIIMNKKTYFKTFQLFPNENSNQTPFRQFQPGDLDKENLQRSEFGDPLDKLRPSEGTKPTAPDEPTHSFATSDVPTHSFATSDVPTHYFATSDVPTHSFATSDKPTHSFATSDVPTHSFATSDVPTHSFATSDVPTPSFATTNVPAPSFVATNGSAPPFF